MRDVPTPYWVYCCSRSPLPYLIMENRSSYLALHRHSQSSTTDLAELFADSAINVGFGKSSYVLMYMGKALPAILQRLPLGVIYDALDCGKGIIPFSLEVNYTALGTECANIENEDTHEQAFKQALYLLDTATFMRYTWV